MKVNWPKRTPPLSEWYENMAKAQLALVGKFLWQRNAALADKLPDSYSASWYMSARIAALNATYSFKQAREWRMREDDTQVDSLQAKDN